MKLNTALIAGVIVSSGVAGSGMAAQTTSGAGVILSSVLLQYGRADDSITRAFRSVLRRQPTERELLRYQRLMERDGWSEQDVRRDLAGRTDYYRSSNRGLRPDAAVRDAYRDVLGRDPDAEGLANYREKIRRAGWTEQDVREALRKSDEYRDKNFQTGSADRIIRRAYQDVLHRQPDPAGLDTYRRFVLEDGWEYHDVRQALLRSPERRQTRRVGLRDSDAREMVRRAYLSVLNREPDPDGLRSYTTRVMREGWTEDRVVRALRESPEYRNRHR